MSDLLQGLNVYLIGMMGSGKTTIGKHLAQQLQYRFIDTDGTIETIAKKSIPAIFEESGESSFRQLETQVLDCLSSYTRSVVSTGGGTIQLPMNWSYLRNGLVVWLDVDVEILKKRVAQNENRPLAGKLESLLEARLPLYAQADLRVSTKPKQSPSEVAAKIIELIPSVLKSQVEQNSFSCY